MLMIIPCRSINDGKQSRVSISGAVKLTASWRARSSGIGIGEQSRQAQTGVVDQNIEPAKSSDRLGDQALGRRRVGEVGRDRKDLEARLKRLQLAGELVRADRPGGRSARAPAPSSGVPARVPVPPRCRRRRR